MRNTVIIGGGISGLSAAYYLAKSGAPSILLEPRPRLGGVIQTDYVEGCTVEAGPDSFLSSKPAALELIRDLGLSHEVIHSNDHLRVTLVRKKGRLVPLPDGLLMIVPTKLFPILTSPLLSWRTKIRMAAEIFRAPMPRLEDQSVAAFVEEHYGREAVDYLAEPLLAGIYGGDPEQLSVVSVLPRFVELAARYGSLTRGVLATRSVSRAQGQNEPLFRTLKGGLGTLVQAVVKAMEAHATVRQVRAETIERFGAGFRVKAGGEWIEAAQVVVASEAHHAARLVAAVDPRLSELLGQIPYRSSVTAAIGYRAADFRKPPSGFGFLVPKKERRRVLACTWVGTKFPNRVPEDMILARCFLGGGDAGILSEPDEAITALVTAELGDIAGVTARPVFIRIFRWPQSMAQYTVGHEARMTEIRSRMEALPGLHLAGNAYEGIGIPDCIRLGKRAAERILGRPCP